MNRNSDYIINFDLPRIFKKSVGKVTDTVTAIREEIATDIFAFVFRPHCGCGIRSASCRSD